MKAVIAAGGLGTRLNLWSPKSLLEVGGNPLIYYIVKTLEETEIDEVLICMNDTGLYDRDGFSIDPTVYFNDMLNHISEKFSKSKIRFKIEMNAYYRHPLSSLMSRTALKFIGKGPFMFLYGDDIFSSDVIPKELGIYKRTGESVACKAPLTETQTTAFSCRNGVISSYSDNKKPKFDLGVPLLLAERDFDTLGYALKEKELRLTILLKRIVDERRLHYVNPRLLINVNYKKDVRLLERYLSTKMAKRRFGLQNSSVYQ